MLDGTADALDGQEDRGQLSRKPRPHAIEIPVHDECVGPERQVRPVLFDRGDREDRDVGGHIRRGEVPRGQLGPETGWEHGAACHSNPPVVASLALEWQSSR